MKHLLNISFSLFVFAITTAVTLSVTSPAAAQNRVEKLGDFTDWAAYRHNDGNNRVCYMATTPKSSSGNYTRRGQIYFIISHWPGQSKTGVSSFVAGYNIQENSTVEVGVDNAVTYTLHPQGDTAWARDADDPKLIASMKKGLKMSIRGSSWRGTKTTDEFSLAGFSAAFKAITAACN